MIIDLPKNEFLTNWLSDYTNNAIGIWVTSQQHLGELWTYIKAEHPKDFNLACMQYGLYRLGYDSKDGFKHCIIFAVKEYIEYTPKASK